MISKGVLVLEYKRQIQFKLALEKRLTGFGNHTTGSARLDLDLRDSYYLSLITSLLVYVCVCGGEIWMNSPPGSFLMVRDKVSIS